MNAVERLNAAIEKLERERNEASSGVEYWRQYNPLRGDCYGMNDDADETVATFAHRSDAVLAETLHLTIDAQLAILRVALAYEKSMYGTGAAEEFHRKVLALASAILGES